MEETGERETEVTEDTEQAQLGETETRRHEATRWVRQSYPNASVPACLRF